jgi:hypothetical protein
VRFLVLLSALLLARWGARPHPPCAAGGPGDEGEGDAAVRRSSPRVRRAVRILHVSTGTA